METSASADKRASEQDSVSPESGAPKHPVLNHILFAVFTLVLGALAGAFVWLFFFLLNHGIQLFWHDLPARIGAWWWPLAFCLVGGVVIGLFQRKFGPYPEDLNQVMAQVKATGRYEYDHLGAAAGGALLPLLFGGSVGPEAGLTGVIAGLCTWVGDRLKFLGTEFRRLASVGTAAVITAVFNAPLFGLAAPLLGSCDEVKPETKLEVPRTTKIIVYTFAVAGALGAIMLLGSVFGGGEGLPHFDTIAIGWHELALVIPLALVGGLVGVFYHIFDRFADIVARKIGDRPVAKATLAGLVLGVLGIVSPFIMFAGESQTETLAQMWTMLGAGFLIATGVLKIFMTPFCLRLGWRGGHFFPTIFAGICLGYGFALLTGADPVSCLCICCAAVMGGIMRQPIMTVLLLFLLFPISGFFIMLVAACIGAAVSALIIRPGKKQPVKADEASDGHSVAQPPVSADGEER